MTNPTFTRLFTSRCLLCDGSHTNHHQLCPDCHGDLPWIESACVGCGLPLPTKAEHVYCGKCINNPSPINETVIPFTYQHPVNSLVNQFKHRGQLQHGLLLSRLLAAEITDHYRFSMLPDAILPTPIHWRRLLTRGFNQAAEISRQLGTHLNIPITNHLLRRTRATPKQQGLNRQQRLKNLQHSFELSSPLAGLRVALVDDVVTTGATANTIARVLLDRGACEVHLWALARTPSTR